MTNGTKLKNWIKENRVRREEVCAWLDMSIGTLKKMLNDDPTVGSEYWEAARQLMSRPAPRFQKAV